MKERKRNDQNNQMEPAHGMDVPQPSTQRSSLLPSLGDLWSHVLTHAPVHYDPVNCPHLVPPVLVKSAFDVDFLQLDQVCDAISMLQSEFMNRDSPYLRVYVDGMLSPKHEFELLRTDRRPSEDLKTWLERALASERFGVVINGAEQWSRSLADQFAQVFAPLVSAWSIPAVSLEITFFIGNYGFTPFGVHIDDPYTDVYHFHLGPSSKSMTLFTPDLFHSLVDGCNRCFDPMSILSRGTTFSINAQDLFFLPAHFYHVGFTPEFSVSIALAASRYPQEMMIRHAVAAARESLENFTLQVGGDDIPISEWLRQAREEHTATARSRGGFRYSPARQPASIGASSMVEWNKLFPIEMRHSGTSLQVFVRGHRISLANHHLIEDCLNFLTGCGPISVSKLGAKFMQIEETALIALLRELECCGGLLVHSDVESNI